MKVHDYRGWFNDGYRHSLAAKGIRTSFAKKTLPFNEIWKSNFYIKGYGKDDVYREDFVFGKEAKYIKDKEQLKKWLTRHEQLVKMMEFTVTDMKTVMSIYGDEVVDSSMQETVAIRAASLQGVSWEGLSEGERNVYRELAADVQEKFQADKKFVEDYYRKAAETPEILFDIKAKERSVARQAEEARRAAERPERMITKAFKAWEPIETPEKQKTPEQKEMEKAFKAWESMESGDILAKVEKADREAAEAQLETMYKKWKVLEDDKEVSKSS